MPHPHDAPQTANAHWDASGRTVDAEQAQGHAPEQLTAVQLALVSMGYQIKEGASPDNHEGDGVDGQWSEGMRQAILQFQDDKGLEPTGKLDDETDEAILQAYGEALVASGAGALFEDGFDALRMGDAPASVEAAAPTTPGSIEDLVPGELPDEPVVDFLDDATPGTTR